MRPQVVYRRGQGGQREELRRLLLDKGYTPVEIVEKNVINDISQIRLFKRE